MPSNTLSKMGRVPATKEAPSFMAVFRIAAFAVCVGCTCYLTGCFPLAGQWQFQEGKRLKSPDAEVEAVLLTGDAGATTSKSTWVVIVPSGGHVDTNNPQQSDVVFKADHLKNFNVVWKQPHLLEIQYEEARISGFKNFWEIWEGRDTSYAVEVRLGPSNSSFAVPLEDRMPHSVYKPKPM
jgi:hypothetical protein